MTDNRRPGVALPSDNPVNISALDHIRFAPEASTFAPESCKTNVAPASTFVFFATPKPYTSLAPCARPSLLLHRRLAYSQRSGRNHPCGIPLPPGGHHLPGLGSDAGLPLPPLGRLGRASLPPPGGHGSPGPGGIVFHSLAATLCSGGRLSLPADLGRCCGWAAPFGIPLPPGGHHLPGLGSGAGFPLPPPGGLGSPGPGGIVFSSPTATLGSGGRLSLLADVPIRKSLSNGLLFFRWLSCLLL